MINSVSVDYFINILLFILPIMVILHSTFKDKIRSPFLLRLCGAVVFFILLSFAGAVAINRFGTSRIIQTFLVTTTTLGGMVIFYSAVNYRITQSIFIAAIAKCYSDEVSLLSSVVYYMAYGKFPRSISEFPAWPSALVVAVTFPLILLFFKKLLRPALNYSDFLPFWSYLWLIPFLVNTLYPLYLNPVFIPENSYDKTEIYLMAVFWVFMTFAIFTILLKMIAELSKNALLQEKFHISEVQNTAHLKQLEQLQQYIQDTSRARHDMRHHLLALQGFVDHKDFDGLTAYLGERLRGMDSGTPELYTKNSAVNAILRYYRAYALAEGFSSEVHVSLPDVLPIPDTDLCIILGNLLENALEACQRQTSGERYMNVRLSMASASILVIIVENSHSNDVRQKDGIFLSSKQRGRKGIGIASILEVAEHYHGVPKFEYDREKFRASLLLTGRLPVE